jgi:hypothetical protein
MQAIGAKGFATLVVRDFAGDTRPAIAWLHARFRGDTMADYRPISVGAAAVREERLKFEGRLASSRWSESTGRAFHPQDSHERIQSASYISFSVPKLAWRNLMDRSVGRSPCARRSDRPKHPGSHFAVQCEIVCLSPSTRERLPLPLASVSSDRSALGPSGCARMSKGPRYLRCRRTGARWALRVARACRRDRGINGQVSPPTYQVAATTCLSGPNPTFVSPGAK